MRRSTSRNLLNGLIWDTEATGPHSSLDNLPKDMDTWSCGHWITYKNRLINTEGIISAKVILLNDMERSSIWASLNNSCHFDCDFIAEFEALGPEFNFSVFTDVFCAGHKAVETTADTVADITSGIGNTASMLALVLPLVVIGGSFYAFKNPNKIKKLIKN